MRNPRGLTNTNQRVYEEFPPSSDWSQDSNNHFLIIDLPGFKREEIKVRVDNLKKVSVSGERLVSDNKYSRFKQIYQMPDDSDVDAVNGKFEGGVLFLIIPKKKDDTVQHPKDEIAGENESKNEEKTKNPSKDDDKSRSAEKTDKKPEIPKINDVRDKGSYEKKDKDGKEEPETGDKKPDEPKISDDRSKEKYVKKDQQSLKPKLSDYIDKGKYGKEEPHKEETKVSHADQGKYEIHNELSKVAANIKDAVNKGKYASQNELSRVAASIKDGVNKSKYESQNELSKAAANIKDVVNKSKDGDKVEPTKEKVKINDDVYEPKHEKNDKQGKEPKKDRDDGSGDIPSQKKEGWAGMAKVEEDLRKVADKVKNKEEMEVLVKTTMENIIKNKKIIITAVVAFSIGFCISRKLK